MNIFSLKGKIIIVTGGAGYFGKPICFALAEAGAEVIIASRNEKKCKELSSEIKLMKLRAEGMELDLASENSISAFIERVFSKYKQIDVLINNAVSREGFKDLEEISKSEWESSQLVNSTGTMLLTKGVVSLMRKQGFGNIINISSIQGAVGPNFMVYGDSGMTSPVNYTYDKWAMVGFTKWLANYYGKFNIRANCISPGGYGPGLNGKKGIDDFVENYKRLTPLGRFADDDDIKGPVIFLASNASSYITGHNLLVDGGWTSW